MNKKQDYFLFHEKDTGLNISTTKKFLFEINQSHSVKIRKT